MFSVLLKHILFQPGFGYQQQLVPGMRPGAAPMPNFMVPMVQQGQQGHRPGGRRGGVQQNQQPLTVMPQQVISEFVRFIVPYIVTNGLRSLIVTILFTSFPL